MSLVSAVVCTRNRPADVLRAVRSLLVDEDPTVELIVVDQSDGPETGAAIEPLAAGGRLRYLRSARRGKGAALNEGLRAARGEIVVFTDDDFEAPAGRAS